MIYLKEISWKAFFTPQVNSRLFCTYCNSSFVALFNGLNYIRAKLMATIQSRVLALTFQFNRALVYYRKCCTPKAHRPPMEKKKILLCTIYDICHEGQMEQEMERRSSHCEEFQLYLCRYYICAKCTFELDQT